jgi:hypothetical protein
MCVGTCNPSSGGQAYWSTPYKVNVGDTVYGTMNNDYGQVWTITTKDITTNQPTSMQINTSVNFSEAVTTLESYNLPEQCSYLSGNAYFTSLTLDGGSTTPNWSTGTGTDVWCNINPINVSSTEIDLHTQS